MAADIDLRRARRSEINLDNNNYSSDLSLGDEFAITELFDDFVLAEYIDVQDGFIKDENSDLVYTKSSKEVWRKAKIIMVGPSSRFCKVGDLVVFPDDKGLKTGFVKYKDPLTQETKETKYGFFTNDYKLFAKIEKA